MLDKDAAFPPQDEDSETQELAAHDAKQAATLRRMRYVLAGALLLVICLFALLYFVWP